MEIRALLRLPITKGGQVLILYPDPKTPQPDNPTTVFAAPVDIGEFDLLTGIAEKNADYDELNRMGFVIIDPDDCYFMTEREDEITYESSTADRGTLILLRQGESYETCLESVAWLRFTKEYTGQIYVTTFTHEYQRRNEPYGALNAERGSICLVDTHFLLKNTL